MGIPAPPPTQIRFTPMSKVTIMAKMAANVVARVMAKVASVPWPIPAW